jgi:hypothetical protein
VLDDDDDATAAMISKNSSGTSKPPPEDDVSSAITTGSTTTGDRPPAIAGAAMPSARAAMISFFTMELLPKCKARLARISHIAIRKLHDLPILPLRLNKFAILGGRIACRVTKGTLNVDPMDKKII